MKARQRGRLVTPADCANIAYALAKLKSALVDAKDAQANNVANKIRSAIKSGQGALNNAQAHMARQNRRQP